MATTPVSAFASPGLSGGAVGSSQSPNWKPGVPQAGRRQQRLDPADVRGHRRRTACARTSMSPYACQSAQGTHTAASPQIAVLSSAGNVRQAAACTSGRRGRRRGPGRRRPAARRRGPRASPAGRPRRRTRNAADGANTARSPVQPSRSSRCGQSVGTSTTLPRSPHTTFRCSWVSIGVGAREVSGPAQVGVDDDGDQRAPGRARPASRRPRRSGTRGRSGSARSRRRRRTG